jgi:hypothetical protein
MAKSIVATFSMRCNSCILLIASAGGGGGGKVPRACNLKNGIKKIILIKFKMTKEN